MQLHSIGFKLLGQWPLSWPWPAQRPGHPGIKKFQDATLAHVIRDVNRYTTKKFFCADDTLGKLQLAGVFASAMRNPPNSPCAIRLDIAAADDNGIIRLSRTS